MVKIRVMSDLHIEAGDLEVPNAGEDVVVLAGDVHVGIHSARWSLGLAEKLSVPVVLVAGNHEHYGAGRDRQHSFGGTIEALRAAAADSDGRLVFLEREAALVAGVRFVGATLWTDFDLFGAPAESMRHAQIGMTDFHVVNRLPGVRFTAADARREFVRAKRFLEEELKKPHPGPTVVVTHHAPSARSVPARFKDHPLTPAYASHIDELVTTSGAALWAHGHMHDSVEYAIGATRVVCNPRGYAGYELNRKFDPCRIIEIASGREARKP